MQLHQALQANATMLAFIMMADPDEEGGRYFRIEEFLSDELQSALATKDDRGYIVLSAVHEDTGDCVQFTASELVDATRAETQPWGYPTWSTKQGLISLFIASPI